MSVDTVTRAACKDIFDGRFYPTTFLQSDGGWPRFPAGRYTIVGGETHSDACGSDDDGSTDDTRVQIDVVGNTHSERKEKVAEVCAAMNDLDPPCLRDGPPIETFDEETRTYRAILFFTFYASSVGS